MVKGIYILKVLQCIIVHNVCEALTSMVWTENLKMEC